MYGKAQQFFIANGGTLPPSDQKWPYVHAYFPYIDYALASHLVTHCEEEVAAFIAYLSYAARAGHVCVRIENQTVTPNPAFLCEKASEELAALIIRGAAALPEHLITHICPLDQGITTNTPVTHFQNCYYFQRYWKQESSVLHNFQTIAASAPSILLNPQVIDAHLEALQHAHTLLPEQAQAIRLACTHCLTLIVGGPGTGKTFTAGELIKTFWAAMPEADKSCCRIALAAPTGKAAANLHKSLQRAIANIPDFPEIKPQTLHSLLGMRGSKKSLKNDEPLEADLILIDESSMIDVLLMDTLLSAVKPGARLILIGDSNQLPPVGIGMIFSDFMNYTGCCVELKKCLRAELQSIIDFLEKINNGDAAGVLSTLAHENSGIRKLDWKPEPIHLLQQAVLDFAIPHFFNSAKKDPKIILESFAHFCILCPLRQGPLGVDTLNQLFATHMMRLFKNSEWFAAPILLVANDAKLELSNGELGVLMRRLRPGENPSDLILKAEDYALFPAVEGLSEARRLPALALPKFEYAYCLSVHKSQGSEFAEVLLLMPEGSERFGREVLYTAVSRTRQQIHIWGSDDTLRSAIAIRSHRLSGVSERLDAAISKVRK